MKKSIIWLASYPKSGNTWTRIFLANYMANMDQPVPINQVHRFCMGDTIGKTYQMVAGRQIDLGDVDLTLQLRDRVLQGIVANNADVNLVKTHNLNTVARGVPLIPERFTRSAVYIMRNPLDMVVSFARHYGISHKDAVHNIGHIDHANAADGQSVTQFLGTWSNHVKSWTAKQPFPSLIMRYEDILSDPKAEFSKLLTHIGLPVDAQRLEKSIKFSSFKELSKQEKKEGFIERSAQNKAFFATGSSGHGERELAPELVKRIKKDHRKVMKQYGYL